MNWTKRRKHFRSVMDNNKCIYPGSVFDPISARIAEDLGFEVGMFAGSIASMTILGAPDLILLTLSELAEQSYRISRAGNLPLLVDADHGYGNALNVKRTVEELESSGVAALTIEDTDLPQHHGSNGKQRLLSLEEGIGKMKAALEGRQDTNLVITARTSAFKVSNDDDAITRAIAYESTGVDALFFAGISSKKQIEELNKNISIPMFIAPAGQEIVDRTYLSKKGVRICLQSHQPFSAAVHAVHETLKALRDGVPPSEINNIASENLLKSVTRKQEYGRLIEEYL
ncbi:MAG: isocitrate lyase/PEP mutase family protein [Pseudomonadota bacterium]|nr:isocitrate lyase/PEP mutase family protein [Pseudomonadota bacterium]